MTKKLFVDDGRGERELLLVGTLVVGRDPLCEISGDNSLLSRRHAEFVVQGDTVVVRDLGSRNGVFVNGVRVAERVLQRDDAVRVGHLQLRFVEDAMPLGSAVDARATAAERPGTAFGPAAGTAKRAEPPATDDSDYTRRVPPPAGAQTGEPFDEDHTRVVAPPSRPVYVAPNDDDELTGFVPAPRVPASAVAAAPAPAPAPTRTARVASGSWTSFVFVQLAVMAVVVFVASALPPLFLGSGNMLAVAGAALVAAVAVFVTGTAITRRTLKGLTELKEDVEYAAAGALAAVDDPIGATPVRELATSINRIVAGAASADKRTRRANRPGSQ